MNMKLIMGIAAGIALWYLFSNDTNAQRKYLQQVLAAEGDTRLIAVLPNMTKDEISILYDAVANYSSKAKLIPQTLRAKIELIMAKYNIPVPTE